MALANPNQTYAIAKVNGGDFPAIAATYVWTDGFSTPAPPAAPGPQHIAAGHYRLTVDQAVVFDPAFLPAPPALLGAPGTAVMVTAEDAPGPIPTGPAFVTYQLVDETHIDVFTWVLGLGTPILEDRNFCVRLEVSPTMRT